MRKIHIALALAMAAPMAACTTAPPSAIVSAKVAGSAESAYQAFVVAEENLVAAGKLDRATFRDHEQRAYTWLLAVRAGQMTADAFAAKLATFGAGGIS
ncbi:hypothetical protein [Novosphingobium sp. SG707]|uniref:hypothetical protein n=1 Tax=Novosphingobium sp. SG707 TaxID=2586996 RepID=UPI0014477140|nr:hypothetical protein [Novosphingobium sp. SG707]NKI99567.1 hypothetical protein [Novosphingobium sp. SG707]